MKQKLKQINKQLQQIIDKAKDDKINNYLGFAVYYIRLAIKESKELDLNDKPEPRAGQGAAVRCHHRPVLHHLLGHPDHEAPRFLRRARGQRTARIAG